MGDGTLVPFQALGCYWVERQLRIIYNSYDGELLSRAMNEVRTCRRLGDKQ